MRILIVGNSDGIGSSVAETLADRGHQVIGISRSPSQLAPGRIQHHVCDVASADYASLVARLVADADIDACIYCAGIGSHLVLPDLSGEAHVVDVNFTAMVKTMAALTPPWIARGQGHFIGLSSLADAIASRDAPSYSASKVGFSNYLRSMGLALRPHGIAVTNVRFGFVDTKMATAASKPMMMTCATAARHVVRCLDRRPAQLSVPKIMAAAAWTFGTLQTVRAWFS